MHLTTPRRLSIFIATLLGSLAVPASAQQGAGEQAQGTAWLNQQMAALSARNPASGWNVTASGLRWRRIAGDGTGTHPTANDRVTVHYVGRFTDGQEFDSSVRRGEPISFPLNRVIKGWQQGVPLMGVGDKVELAIPFYLGYGADGKGPIPGGATLLFTVELLGVGGE